MSEKKAGCMINGNAVLSLLLTAQMLRFGVWAATGGGESPTGLFKQRVDEPANSFTKMTGYLFFFGYEEVEEPIADIPAGSNW